MDAIEIVKVEQEGPDGVLVTFSDGTIAGYVVEELLDFCISNFQTLTHTRLRIFS